MAAFPARLRESLGAPVDIASLVVFRIAFGLIMIWEVYRFFAKGWIEAHYREPPFLFPYVGFEWVAPWPGIGLELHFVGLAVLALGIAVRHCVPPVRDGLCGGIRLRLFSLTKPVISTTST